MKKELTRTPNRTKMHIALFSMAIIFALNPAFSQCKETVKTGIDKLAPYTFTGQVNTVVLGQAEKPAEFHLTFYKGRVYKLMVNSDAGRSGVSFRVLDQNKKELYNSKSDDINEGWIFFSNSTQNLVIEVSSSEKEKHCVAVLVGIEMPRNNNSIRDL